MKSFYINLFVVFKIEIIINMQVTPHLHHNTNLIFKLVKQKNDTEYFMSLLKSLIVSMNLYFSIKRLNKNFKKILMYAYILHES